MNLATEAGGFGGIGTRSCEFLHGGPTRPRAQPEANPGLVVAMIWRRSHENILEKNSSV